MYPFVKWKLYQFFKRICEDSIEVGTLDSALTCSIHRSFDTLTEMEKFKLTDFKRLFYILPFQIMIATLINPT